MTEIVNYRYLAYKDVKNLWIKTAFGTVNEANCLE